MAAALEGLARGVRQGGRFRIVYSSKAGERRPYTAAVGGLSLKAVISLWGEVLAGDQPVPVPPEPDIGCFPRPWCACDSCASPDEEEHYYPGFVAGIAPRLPAAASAEELAAPGWLAGLAFEPPAYSKIVEDGAGAWSQSQMQPESS